MKVAEMKEKSMAYVPKFMFSWNAFKMNQTYLYLIPM
jgi:hypothetical protein